MKQSKLKQAKTEMSPVYNSIATHMLLNVEIIIEEKVDDSIDESIEAPDSILELASMAIPLKPI